MKPRRMRAHWLLGTMILTACAVSERRSLPGEPCDQRRSCLPPALCIEGTCSTVERDGGDPFGSDAGGDAKLDRATDGPHDGPHDANGDVAALDGDGPPNASAVVGCSDGEREGFLDATRYPHLAACAGGWTVPGLYSEAARTPQCDRRSGDDDAARAGFFCTAADLCAEGWHVCEGVDDAKRSGLFGCEDALVDAGRTFYATRQQGMDTQAGTVCTSERSPSGFNDVYGCGNIGVANDHADSCNPFRMMVVRPGETGDCGLAIYNPWDCGTDNRKELLNIVKWGPATGGVLCCRDDRADASIAAAAR